jgi:hypothetical protein
MRRNQTVYKSSCTFVYDPLACCFSPVKTEISWPFDDFNRNRYGHTADVHRQHINAAVNVTDAVTSLKLMCSSGRASDYGVFVFLGSRAKRKRRGTLRIHPHH